MNSISGYEDNFENNLLNDSQYPQKRQISEGKEYTQINTDKDITPLGRLARLVAAIFLTAITAFTGLIFSQVIRNLWIEVFTGRVCDDEDGDEATVNKIKDKIAVESDNDDRDNNRNATIIPKVSIPPKNNTSSLTDGNIPSSDNVAATVIDPITQRINAYMNSAEGENLKIFSDSNDQREKKVAEIRTLGGISQYKYVPKIMWIRQLQNDNDMFEMCFNFIKDNNLFNFLFDFIRKLKSDGDNYAREGEAMTKNMLDYSNEALITFNQHLLGFGTSVSTFVDTIISLCELNYIKFPSDITI